MYQKNKYSPTYPPATQSDITISMERETPCFYALNDEHTWSVSKRILYNPIISTTHGKSNINSYVSD